MSETVAMWRREFLRTCVALASGTVLACDRKERSSSGSDGGSQSELQFDASLFPQSVASGDPRPNSVILWTRIVDEDATDRRTLQLELAHDELFESRIALGRETAFEVVAEARFDHCVRVRVEQLEPATEYYYRFSYERDGERFVSRTGRTKTAPRASSDTRVSFAVMSCQDYGGRYYHAQRRASELELDFVVHLGDYVYETAGDPSFQAPDTDAGAEERQMRFSDLAGALHLGVETSNGDAGTAPGYYAARSLDNYRDLYRTVRSDRDLQRLHERFPMICVPDDHEFVNDSYAETSNQGSDAKDVPDPERRRNADQAWFEYMPVDYMDPDFEFDATRPVSQRLTLYRDFRFGRHVHLLMTDLRRYRADHLIPEDALPGRVVLSEARLLELESELPDFAEPYVDLDEFPELVTRLSSATEQGFELGFPSEELSGLMHLGFLNQVIERHNASGAEPAIEALAAAADAPRGVAYLNLGKTEASSSFGATLFVEPESFALYARDRFERTDGESEQVMGPAQEAWFIATLEDSDATWKVWGNAYTLSHRRLDLRGLVLDDPSLSRLFQLSADDWDGFPNRRRQLLEQLANVSNLVAVTGDSHSFFASTLGIGAPLPVVEFVCGALSSSTYAQVLGAARGVPSAALALAPIAGPLIARANPHVAYQNITDNGFATVECDEQTLTVTFHQVPHEEVGLARLTGSLASHFSTLTFRLQSGSTRIERKVEGGFETWDEQGQRWT